MKGLVKRYKQDTKGVDGKLRDQLIMDYAPLIRFVAQRIAARLPSNIDIDDLISAGVIGLMDAIEKYDPSRDNKFKTYAEFRIRGAILDELRSQDWIPRSMREKAKIVERAFVRLEQEFGRVPQEKEVAKELGMNLEEFQEALHQCKSISLLSLDEIGTFANGDRKSLLGLLESGKATNPMFQLANSELKQQLAAAIQDLPEKQRMVL